MSKIEKEIEDLIKAYEVEVTVREKNRLKDEIDWLRKIKLYLDAGVRREYLLREIEKIQNKIFVLQGRYSEYKATRFGVKFSDYESSMNIPTLKLQVKTLKKALDFTE